jgi:hypothetical protein
VICDDDTVGGLCGQIKKASDRAFKNNRFVLIEFGRE